MDSELSSISDVKALDQSVVSGATPTFTVTNFSDVSNKRFMSDAQETLLNSVETNADVTDTANVKSSLNASLGGSANIGDGSDTITIPGDLVVTGTTTTENVTTLTTSNGIVFEGSVADEHEATLLAGTLSADRTLTLPNATGTIALTSDLATVGAGGLTQQNFTTTLKNKLDGIEGSATADQSNAEIRAAVEAASDSNVFTDTDHSKLNAIEASATADQSNAEIRAAVEAATDSNVFTDSDHSKLNAIEASADVTDTTNVTSAGALMDSEVTNLSQVKSFDSSDYLASSVTTITSTQAGHITANNDKVTNVSTDLSITGTSGARTIASSDGTNAIIPIATTSVSGLLSPGLFDEIDANTAKTSDINHNVSTDLSKTTSTTNVTINSSDGNNVSIGAASTSVAGVMTKSMFDKLDGIASSANNYVLPTNFAGDDFSLDTGALTGATVISDIDINITTDTSGRVSDANGTVATRTLTLANLGYTGDTDATNDQTATEIRSLVGTGNSGVVPSAGSNGQFLKHDGTFGTPSYTTNTDVSVSAANFKSRLAGGYAGNAAQIGDSGDTITIPGDLVVSGTTTTNNVEVVSTTNGVVFEGNAADANEITLLAATVSADRTITLPNASGTVALTSNIITNNNQITNGEGYISSFDITAQTDSKYLRSNANDTATGIISITNSTASTSKTTGALKVTGGVGIAGALNVGGDIVAYASSDERLKDNIELIS
ncbi:MAG: beta strand repeat-containing protein, partial [Methylophagaceae bacterium]